MAINTSVIGKEIEGQPFTYTKQMAIIYALGIGAGPDELSFIYEKNLKVFPTFGIVPVVASFAELLEKTLNLNMSAVVHGEQHITSHKPLAPSGTIKTTAIVNSIYDKGDNGAVVNISSRGINENGELLFEARAAIIDRSGGNFGGDRGPKVQNIATPEGNAPDFEITEQTAENQAAIYRLIGDKSPLHIDPDFAKAVGFKKPLLQGLCTYGFTYRAVLKALCKGDISLLKSFGGRFKDVVFPGDNLITKGWKLENGSYTIQTETSDGRVVIGNGLAELA